MNLCTETVESAKECSSKSDLVKAAATICIVNYRTLDLTKLCLRCISKFARYRHQVIVVDNDSRDESLEYLRSISRLSPCGAS
jgi:GT2 family glycosyltransferase